MASQHKCGLILPFPKALYRDKYRCLVTRYHDFDHFPPVLSYEEQNKLTRDTFFAVTFACNIIPPLPTQAQDPHSLDRAWDFFLNFSSISFDELSSAAFSLTNILTLAHEVTYLFSLFHVWLEPVRVSAPRYLSHFVLGAH